MPVLKHAKKKLRQDKKRTLRNKTIRNLYKKLIKKAHSASSGQAKEKAVSAAFKQIDKAAKNHIIHDNKASHLKSALSKVVGGTASNAAKAAPAKPETKKAKPKTTKSAAKPKAEKTTKAPRKSSKTVEQ
ncbi:MAG: 30S ribosomal protein S20 [Candidatus Levybacteria bacterium]|nr:30S ribosomal protein S20 [Candidatus Levybacteria bacterium]